VQEKPSFILRRAKPLDKRGNMHLLEKGAVTKVPNPQPQENFNSTPFVAPKKGDQ